MTRLRTAVLWVGAGALVVLIARWLAYAVVPSPAARLLEQQAGGPGLPVLTLVSLTLAGGTAVTICWLAAFGVRERVLLERRVLAGPPPRFHAARTLLFALVLSVGTSIAGGLLEAYIHWRAGLGWHGLHCVFGPVHRDLLPFEAGLSFVAAALIAAAEHVAAWMRRTFALLRTLPPRTRGQVPPASVHVLDVPRTILCPAAGTPRAPPALS
jgi:hypothetical protein